MSLKVESIGCFQLKGEEVIRDESVTFSGEYWPRFIGNTPNDCPLRLDRELMVADFIACASCRHSIVKFTFDNREVND